MSFKSYLKKALNYLLLLVVLLWLSFSKYKMEFGTISHGNVGDKRVYLYTLCIVLVDMLKSTFYDIISKMCAILIPNLQIYLDLQQHL